MEIQHLESDTTMFQELDEILKRVRKQISSFTIPHYLLTKCRRCVEGILLPDHIEQERYKCTKCGARFDREDLSKVNIMEGI